MTSLAIIGLSGYVRRAYLPFLAAHPELELKVVCDPRDPAELAAELQAQGLPAPESMVADIDALLCGPPLDAVIISTPHVHHFVQTRRCLEAGLHVLVDKPLACTYRDALALAELAEARNLALAVGSQRRFEPPYQHLKARLMSGEVGRVHLVNYLFANSRWYDYSTSWRGDPQLNCGGAMVDIGHLAGDMLVWLIDKPLRWVEALAQQPSGGGAEETAVVVAAFGESTIVNLVVTYAAPAPSIQEELSIYGSKVSLFARRFRPRRSLDPPQIYEIGADGSTLTPDFSDPPHLWRPLEDFLASAASGRAPIASGRSHLETMKLLDAVARSMRERRRVDADSI